MTALTWGFHWTVSKNPISNNGRCEGGMAQRKFNLNSNRRPSSGQCYCLQATLGHVREAYWTTRIVSQKKFRANNDNRHIYFVMPRTVSHTVFMWVIRNLRFCHYHHRGRLSVSRPVLQLEENSRKLTCYVIYGFVCPTENYHDRSRAGSRRIVR